MKLNYQREITRQDLENIFVTAIEGGSNYWYFFDEEACFMVRKAVPKDKDPYFSTAVLSAVIDHGVELPVSDVEDGEVIGTISLSTMEERLQKLFDNKELRPALENLLDDNGDASDADVVFQFICMGEVVYG